MKIGLFIAFLFIAMAFQATFANDSLDSLLIRLDHAIDAHNDYSRKKENIIDDLKKKAGKTSPATIDRYEHNMLLYKEYKSYKCDSAILYLNHSIHTAHLINDIHREYRSMIMLAYLMGSTGMYKEGVDILNEVNRSCLPEDLQVEYFDAYYHVYGELAFYTQNKEKARVYSDISDRYKDSLNLVMPVDCSMRAIMIENDHRNSGNYKEANRLNDIRLAQAEQGTPEHALTAYHRSLTYRYAGDKPNQKYYLALSALSDIRSTTKDHASLWTLAQILFEEGDLERAYRYIRFSWDETVFYNARLRSLQSAVILSLIDKTYQALIVKQKTKIQNALIVIGALLPMLMIALLYIYRQMKRISAVRKRLQLANNQLKKLNEDLKQMNIRLQSANLELTESNQIKEEYIGRFIELCSTYINKLDAYRRMVHKKISGGQVKELLKMTSSQSALDEELKALYVNFDTAFLQIFPDFARKVNALLNEDEQIILKKGELLNTELRILALIRLGIDDSSQIAEFLRYSVNTIYNDRAKIKNRARISRDDFENILLTIR